MVKGYWVVGIDVHDQEKFQAYVAATPEILKKYSARLLAGGDNHLVPEGSARSRNMIIEFPSYQSALDCWNSTEYQQAIKLRLHASKIDLVIIEGFKGPQPS
ncbi:DUF1330 domain-containing protein [Paenibacillus terrae]|uniref:DUF1330 domain-containing protein n=1 Tax=Paenibacillus terrae (strain HPL-003) TaxID=985665 RepID=G7VPP5_PAETH|nr:DUF1330 domain-containing protein [Paenibacillus terrae]AET61043.1 hypothetical protein HPL003_21575 [Paenibacillus terrae HPL-003]